jgi:hypothetical protein
MGGFLMNYTAEMELVAMLYRLSFIKICSVIRKIVRGTHKHTDIETAWRLHKGKGKVVPVLNLIKHYAMKAYGGVDV